MDGFGFVGRWDVGWWLRLDEMWLDKPCCDYTWHNVVKCSIILNCDDDIGIKNESHYSFNILLVIQIIWKGFDLLLPLFPFYCFQIPLNYVVLWCQYLS